MRLEIHHYHHIGDVEDLNKVLHAVKELGESMSAELDELKAKVAKNTTVTKSAVTLIRGIAQRITDAGTDAAQLKALSDELSADDDALAAAVAENTPAEETGGTGTGETGTGETGTGDTGTGETSTGGTETTPAEPA